MKYNSGMTFGDMPYSGGYVYPYEEGEKAAKKSIKTGKHIECPLKPGDRPAAEWHEGYKLNDGVKREI